ncbi:response regulator transcription factor [uncultured Phascolarctobacterium sp.]|uniref:response regulator transcription factor n=1 Tax=uncultured Phascolarctobacterium sp. TaxID=512296 RepID=UPI002638AD96|nr:response regulator transcription factor [uncultured Phascolarctobacterium sp.]
MKILLAEDDLNLGKLLTMLLKKQNINTVWAQDGEEAYSKVYADGYDVLVLDWMMPKLSGVELCRRLREEDYQGKILLLTAKDTVADKVQGLNAGADDYLVKPFAMEELVARLHALCRRQAAYNVSNLSYGDYVLEAGTYCLAYGEQRVELRPREYKLLELLLLNKGHVMPRAVLQDRIWGIDSDVTENNLDVHIRLLRKKISSLHNEELIKTLRGVGYYVE